MLWAVAGRGGAVGDNFHKISLWDAIKGRDLYFNIARFGLHRNSAVCSLEVC